MKFEKNAMVTLDITKTASNVFTIDTDEGETVLLSHPLCPKHILMRVEKRRLNTVQPIIKDSTERCIDYANSNIGLLDYNTAQDLICLKMYFATTRKLTPRCKQILANICGAIAGVKFNNDIGEAMKFVILNQSLLDDFNSMWFNNFSELFAKRKPISSKRQRGAIFNMAGYVLAELENPTA